MPSTDQTFDNSDQLTAITEHKGSATLASFTYKRDSIGKVMSIDPKGVPGGAESYGYSKLNQLATLDSKAQRLRPRRQPDPRTRTTLVGTSTPPSSVTSRNCQRRQI